MTRTLSFKVAIPARYASTRMPGKMLRLLAGRPLVEHTYRRAVESGADEIVVATDDDRIRKAAEGFGARVCMTASEHQTGTDRLAELAQRHQWQPDQIVVNLQGDEPLMEPHLISQVAETLNAHPDAQIATLCTPIHTTGELFDPHVVKVVFDKNGYALYFSRAPIPWDRDSFAGAAEELPEEAEHYRHIGLYAYRAGFLETYANTNPCYAERAEALEQLRALCSGVRIQVSTVEKAPGHGVDTESDLERVEGILAGR